MAAGQALDHPSRPALCLKQKQRDRLIRRAAGRADWVLGYGDETWWSRLAQPALHSWTEGRPLRLVGRQASRDDPDPKALCCYGLLRADTNRVLLRIVEGRPVSQATMEFLAWILGRLAAEGKKALLLVWDNASWHLSREVRQWIGARNRQAKQSGGVRLLVCRLPIQSPWLNPLEPRWADDKRAIVEPDRRLAAAELIERVCHYFGCEHAPHLKQEVA